MLLIYSVRPTEGFGSGLIDRLKDCIHAEHFALEAAGGQISRIRPFHHLRAAMRL